MKVLFGLLALIGLFAAGSVRSEQPPTEPYDELNLDERLSLKQVVDATFEKYPQNALVAAFQEEARALDQRSSSWIAGYPLIYLQWIDDTAFSDKGLGDIQTGYQIPLWMWGQKAASQAVADEARKSAEFYAKALRHEVAGLVRDALWSLRLVENRYELARQIHEVAQRLVAVVRRRVELGDLARADLLLAESDQLEKRTALVQAQAEVGRARKAYQNLTRLQRVPKDFEEQQSPLAGFDQAHPALAAANALVERAQAEVEFSRLSKQGNQPSVLIGTDSSRGSRHESFNTGTNLVVQVPIGGDAWNAPQVAQANVALNERIAQREALWRQLEKALNDILQSLEMDRAALEIAQQRKEIAETQLKMSRLAFETGEIALIDYLKIQASAQAAIRDAAERAILVQKDTAFYNQVVGVTP
jgi:outer membrane protein TolC